MLYDALIAPFSDFEFMRRALAGGIALSLGGAPVGVFLMLRRMSLVGDAMSHAILPGAAVGFLIGGLSLPAMSLGGFGAGLAVATLSGLVARATEQREDASFASFYLISLALGVLLVSTRGGNVDLLHVLFGSVLAVDDAALILVTSIASVTLLTLAVIYRPLVMECFDPSFLRAVGGGGSATHLTFLVLVVLNLVGGFQALGTLLAVGLMMLPATAARFWVRGLWSMALVAFAIAFASGWLGLVVSFWFNLPSGPAIILAAGGFYLLSLGAGVRGGLLVRLRPGRHRAA